MALRKCHYPADAFCYVCGEFIKTRARKYSVSTSQKMNKAYFLYFGMPVGDQDKHWAPHFACELCTKSLERWLRGQQKKMPFAVPRIWREPTNHHNDCYFCMVDVSGRKRGKTSAQSIHYPNIPSSIAPVPHGDGLPVPQPPPSEIEFNSEDDNKFEDLPTHDRDYCDEKTNEPHFPNQSDINDLIRDLNLTKENGEILTSRLKQWNLLSCDVRVTQQRKRQHLFSTYFTLIDGVCYCHDITGLFEAIEIPCTTADWRLFIDSSQRSLKVVLLHNGNVHPSIPIAHSVILRERYENVQKLLDLIKYDDYKWEVIGDFKMVAFLMGLQGGWTKYPCHLCLWDSRASRVHYQQFQWPERSEYLVGSNNVLHEPLVDPEKILMPPLHIKLGLIKQFVKAIDVQSRAYGFLEGFFPELSSAKIKAGIFVGPQTKKLMASQQFDNLLSNVERAAWNSFKDVVTTFLGNHKSENHVDLIENLIQNFAAMGCNMSLKLHMLASHLDKFKSNMGAYSEEHGERFHQDIKSFERRYQGQYNENMMGDYIWNLLRESNEDHNRNSRKKLHF